MIPFTCIWFICLISFDTRVISASSQLKVGLDFVFSPFKSQAQRSIYSRPFLHHETLERTSIADTTDELVNGLYLMILTHLFCMLSGFRSSSLSLSPALQRRETNYFRTPPISRGKHKIPTNLIDGSRVAGHVYKHLQEDESSDMESIRRWNYFFVSLLVLSCLFEPAKRKFSSPPSTPRSNSRFSDTDLWTN